jgi:hypothetical protein
MGVKYAVIAITLSLLLPLSLIKDLSALAFTSILGFGAIIYTVIFIIARALDGSYQLPGGRFLQDPTVIAALPAFSKASLWNFDFTSLVLASNLGLACEWHADRNGFHLLLVEIFMSSFSLPFCRFSKNRYCPLQCTCKELFLLNTSLDACI